MGLTQSADDALGGVPGPHDSEPFGKGTGQIGALGEPADGPVDRADGELIIGQLDHQRHDEVGVCGAVPARLAPLGLVVAVGDDKGGRGDALTHGIDHLGLVDDPQLMSDAVVVVGVDHRWLLRLEGCRQPRGEREPPDGGEVGPGRPQQVEAVALGLGQGLLVREDVALLTWLGQAEGTDHPHRAATVGRGHLVGVERPDPLGGEDAFFEPGLEQGGRHLIPVETAYQIGLGQLDEHRVLWGAVGQVHALGRFDHVIGRGDDPVEPDHLGVVPQPVEGFESGHGCSLAHLESRPSRPRRR